MSEYTPNNDFTERIMTEVHRLQREKERRTAKTELLLQNLTVRTALSFTAIIFGSWNILRVCFVLLTPVICK